MSVRELNIARIRHIVTLHSTRVLPS